MIKELKKWYIVFIEKEKHNFFGWLFYGLLLVLSWVYAGAVSIRNILYDYRIIPCYQPQAQVISVGNLSWAGSGKTPLSIWLYEYLCSQWRVCILRRGYGDDEKKLLQEKVGSILSGKDRVGLVKKNQKCFDVFILDDGFQYRRLKYTVNIVVMSAREFRKPQRLIPAYFFREPLTALRRADIVIINHSDELDDCNVIKQRIAAVTGACEVYFSRYLLRRFVDFDGVEYRLDYFLQKPVAAFAAIGYPGGFFRKLRELGLQLKREIVYPDHYALTPREFALLEQRLLNEGVTTLVITHKDKFHFPYISQKLGLFIMEVDMVIDNKERLLASLRRKISRNNNVTANN